MNVEIPEKLLFLFTPNRHKVLYGGRAGAKSWSIARALLCLGTQRPLRILCARETQQSIRESVHQLLSEQIKGLDLREFYRVLEYTIKGANGTEFIFAGLRNLTVEQIKSFESIDIVWVEEAQGVHKKSWEVLIPTIRKPGSEIWVSFNPEYVDDDTFKRWVVSPPPGAIVVKTSYRDNLWLSEESATEIAYLKHTDPDTFEHIYEGATISTIQGAIYKAEIMRCEADGRIGQVPYDASLPVRTFWDLGWSDLVCIWFAQRDQFKYKIIDYHEDNFQSSDHYLQVLQKKGYTYSASTELPAITWPWDAATKMNRESTEQAIRTKGFTLRILEQQSKAGGIDAVRRIFPQLWFDAERCQEGIARLRRYQWGPLPATGQLKREPLHDINSHCFHPDTEVLTRSGTCRIMELVGQEVLTSCGWRTYLGPQITRRNASLVEVQFRDGLTVKCTPEHLFLTENGWRFAESLTPGTSIQSGLTQLQSTSMENSGSDGRVRSIGHGRGSGSIARCGRVLLGQFQRLATFTTKTMIQLITNWVTWSAFHPLSTYPQLGIEFIADGQYPQQHAKLRPHGTDLKQEGCGINGKLENNKAGSNKNVKSGIASSVARKLWHWFVTSIRRGSVQPLVSLPVVAGVRHILEKSDVCCIEVPGPSCFCLANGAIVHNSADALRTMASSIKEREKEPAKVIRPVQPPRLSGPYSPFG